MSAWSTNEYGRQHAYRVARVLTYPYDPAYSRVNSTSNLIVEELRDPNTFADMIGLQRFIIPDYAWTRPVAHVVSESSVSWIVEVTFSVEPHDSAKRRRNGEAPEDYFLQSPGHVIALRDGVRLVVTDVLATTDGFWLPAYRRRCLLDESLDDYSEVVSRSGRFK